MDIKKRNDHHSSYRYLHDHLRQKKKCQKFPTPRGQYLVHRYRTKKKKEKRFSSSAGGKRSTTPPRFFLLSERAYESMGQSSDDRAGCNIIRNVACVRNAWRDACMRCCTRLRMCIHRVHYCRVGGDTGYE